MPQIELTDRFCRSANAAEGRKADFFDTTVRGLCLRASAGGARAFFLVYTKPADGKRAWLKLGRYPELTLAKARERAREARGEIGEGADPIAEKRAAAASQTVADLVDNYVARHASTKRSGDEIARRLRKNVTEIVGSVKLADLHRRDITRCIDAVKDRGAHVEANRLFEDVRAMVRWARGRGDLDSNIVEGMRRPTETVERDRVLTADEIRTLWRALPDADMRESTRRIIRLCLVTGQRVGEIAGMMRAEIDLEVASPVWTIPASRAKNKREHVVPLAPLAVEIIREQLTAAEALADRKERDPPPFVFPAPGGRAAVTAASVPKAVKRLEVNGKGSGSTSIAGIEPWTPHDLRRTAATHMEGLGVSPFIIGHILNHATVTKGTITSRIYARHDYAKEKRDALERWAAALASLLEAE